MLSPILLRLRIVVIYHIFHVLQGNPALISSIARMCRVVEVLNLFHIDICWLAEGQRLQNLCASNPFVSIEMRGKFTIVNYSPVPVSLAINDAARSVGAGPGWGAFGRQSAAF